MNCIVSNDGGTDNLNYKIMYGKFQAHLQNELNEIKEAGLYKQERLIEGPQQAAIQVKGSEVLNFCANNYLGLSNNPRLIQAAKDMMDRRGYGMSSASTRSLKLPFPITSRRRTPFSMPPASMPTAVCSNRCSRPTTPSSPTR